MTERGYEKMQAVSEDLKHNALTEKVDRSRAENRGGGLQGFWVHQNCRLDYTQPANLSNGSEDESRAL